MLLLKHHAEAGRVSLYEGYFYFTGFASPSQGVEAKNGMEEEEVSSACWKMQHHIRKRDQSFPATRGHDLASSGNSMEPANRRPAPGTGSVPLPATSAVTGEQAGCRQPATRTIPGRGNIRACIGRAHRPISAKWAAQVHSHGFGPIRTRCLNGDNQ